MTKSKAEGLLTHRLDLLAHLELARGWDSEEALAALGDYLMSSEAGQRLGRQLLRGNQIPRVA